MTCEVDLDVAARLVLDDVGQPDTVFQEVPELAGFQPAGRESDLRQYPPELVSVTRVVLPLLRGPSPGRRPAENHSKIICKEILEKMIMKLPFMNILNDIITLTVRITCGKR